MNTNLLKGMLGACLFTAMLTPANAQDSYWLLGSNKYLNTTTRAVVTNTALNGPASNPHVRMVYDGSGNEMFSYGANDVTYFGLPVTTPGGVQAFPIAGSCKQYYVLNTGTLPSPHISYMTLTKIDASAGGIPVASSPIILVGTGGAYAGNPFYYGAVAGPLEANGSRYVYNLSGDINSTVCYLYRFTVAANGTVNTTPQLISSSLPVGGGRMKMAADGKSLAYTNASGQLVTVDFSTLSTPVVTTYNKTVLGLGAVTAGGSKRWYVSTGSELGYFTENTTTFNLVSTTNGIKSDIAQGRDGNAYITNGTPSTGTGTLAYFNPTVGTPTFTAIPAAQVIGVNSSSTAYSFGNNVEGEDINSAAGPSSVNFTLNHVSGTSSPGVIWVCSGVTTVPLDATITGMHTGYYFSYQYGTYNGSVFTGTSAVVTNGPIPGFTANYTTPFWVGSGATFIKFTFYVTGACGNTISQTQLFELRPVSILADYSKPGCSGLCSQSLQSTLPITTAAPAPNTAIAIFKANIDAAQGWMGAATAGMYDINTNGIWSISVYEVDGVSGARKIRSGITAPTIASLNGTGSASGTTVFNNFSYAFDPGNPPFYYDASSAYGDGPYFRDYYSFARLNGLLADYSDRVYCADLTVTEPTSGCTVSKKSYFRIANNGNANGGNARPGKTGSAADAGNEDAENPEIQLYPNPASTAVTVALPYGSAPATLSLMDNSGRKVLESKQLNVGKHIIPLQQLPAGLYFYELNSQGIRRHGKLVKQ